MAGLASLDADRRMLVVLKSRKLVRVLLEAGGAEYAFEQPFTAAERADERASGALHERSFTSGGDPRPAAAEGTLPAAMHAVGRPVDRPQELDVGTQDGSRQVVFGR